MDPLYRLLIDSSVTLEQAWNFLETRGIEVLYGSEEGGQTELFAYLSSVEPLTSFPWVMACEPYVLPPIDWQAQWSVHGHNFQEGYVHIDFASFGRECPSLRLQPGAGFGDLSHPTTRLMLTMLARYLQKQRIIDIGCGSGILSLAAIVMGAPLTYGIDIDIQALEHAYQNAVLNHVEAQCIFCTPSDFRWHSTSEPVLILMNMIRMEQLIAWSSLTFLHGQGGELLTSGIQVEEREIYLDQMDRWGWSLKDEREEMGWLAFYFHLKGKRTKRTKDKRT